mmetsp:Transcript_30714/g.65190  ORF Transcript_30714/g.65190 Transcript_30714/m.65190 type:complete len:83 (+) Transcript_30714:55-303(+)
MPSARKPTLMSAIFGSCMGVQAAPSDKARRDANMNSEASTESAASAGGMFDLGRAAKERGQHFLAKTGTLVSQQSKSSRSCA